MGVSSEPDQVGGSPEITTVPFHLYIADPNISLLGFRDLEFLWSDRYRQLGKPLVPPGEQENDLDRFAKTLCTDPSNAFAFPYTDIRLVYDYLNVWFPPSSPSFHPDSLYNTNPQAIGFLVASPDADAERNHVDTYLWLKGQDPDTRSSYPSTFTVNAEDSLTTGDPNTYTRNSLDLIGPDTSQVGSTGANRWTRPDAAHNQAFDHEFEHCLNNDQIPGIGTSYLHLLASAAEVIGKVSTDRPQFDVPYTWNLIRSDGNGGNYQEWQSFAAYVAFNFRGVDTTSSVAGRSDDLLRRWARQADRSLLSLAARLSPAECAECTTKTYFNNLAPADRLPLLLHNWRVANFVNNLALADSQYAFPPQFGFDPMRDLGNWQSVDAIAANDSVAMPHEVTVTSAQLTRDLSFDPSFAPPRTGPKTHSLSLERFGSDYWVVGSDPSLATSNHDLVVRVTPEGGCSGVRLMASVVGYSNQPLPGDSLWKHPEWAVYAVPPRSTDASPPGGPPLEVVLPNFGLTHKAALVVITTSQDSENGSDARVLPYRLNLGLCSGSYLSPNPVPSFTDPSFDDWPAWRPSGDTLVFQRTDGGLAQLHKKGLFQSGSVPLVPQPYHESHPDWSPRGDWVAFDQQTTPTDCDILLYNTVTGELRPLVAANNKSETKPSFSPNGQQLVYVTGDSIGGGQLRRVDLDGTHNTLLFTQSPGAEISSPRWSPDGQTIYFSNGSTGVLYAVPSGGGTAIPRLSLTCFTFDLPPGNGRIVANYPWNPLFCGSGASPIARIFARDTTTGVDEPLFGSAAYHPRWSRDGTRIAYAFDGGSGRDIYFGQVGCNRAPTFYAPVQLPDQEAFLGQPFSLQLNATDPDAEPLTFQGAFLPNGATLGSTGLFSWPDPGPHRGDEYYVVFRALDPSGGVAQQVTKFTVVDPPGGGPGGGCPFADTRTATGWQVENSILGRAPGGRMVTDFCPLKAQPVVIDGRYHLRIREDERERTTLDEVRLLIVDHAPDLQALIVDGRPVLGRPASVPKVTTQDGRDVTALLGAPDGTVFWGKPGDVLTVENPGGAMLYNHIPGHKYGPQRAAQPTPEQEDWAVLNHSGIRLEVAGAAGSWSGAERVYPREHLSGFGFAPPAGRSWRMVFVGAHALDYIGRLEPVAVEATAKWPRLLEADHSRLGDVSGAVGRRDRVTTELQPQERIGLAFEAPALASGQVRDFFLVSHGVYTSQPGPAEKGARAPGRVALAQNQPNPFTATTSIAFRLAGACRVSLEVFDLGGRRVKTLVEEEMPPGEHAVEWDQRDDNGRPLSPGVYLYRLTAGSFRQQKKMVLLSR